MRRRPPAVALLITLVLAACSAPEEEPEASPTPESVPFAVDTMAVVGDSLSAGEASCDGRGECEAASWAMGTMPEVESIATRLEERSGQRPEIVNVARSGATVRDGLDRVDEVVAGEPDLVLVELGGNDVCASAPERLPTVTDVAADYRALLTTIAQDLPEARIIAFSVPSPTLLVDQAQPYPELLQLWEDSGFCATVLGQATSQEPEAVAERAAMAARAEDLSQAIAQVCQEVPQCVDDGGAFADSSFDLEQISEHDYFHPSAQGQATIAQTLWPVVERVVDQDVASR